MKDVWCDMAYMGSLSFMQSIASSAAVAVAVDVFVAVAAPAALLADDLCLEREDT